MSKKLTKVISILVVSLMVLSLAAIPVFAQDFTDPKLVQADQDSKPAESVQTIGGKILGVVQLIGVSVAVIMLIVLAIKYISAAPNDKAEIKKHAVVYVVGAVVLFGAAGILEIIKNFAGNF